jgi:hypothetical protein
MKKKSKKILVAIGAFIGIIAMIFFTIAPAFQGK